MDRDERNEKNNCSDRRTTVDIVVPCFNEENMVDAFFSETVKVTSSMEGWSFRFIFVDDGSSYRTLDRIKSLREEHGSLVSYTSLSRNFGKEAAMYAGLERSSADYVLVMDADLQHPPALIREMVSRIEDTGCDCCAARRVTRKGDR